MMYFDWHWLFDKNKRQWCHSELAILPISIQSPKGKI